MEPDEDVGAVYFDLGAGRGRRGPVVSGSGLRLHIDATVFGVRNGTPGVVSDSYLEGLPSATVVADAVELCMAGLWVPSTGGYLVVDHDFVDQVVGIQQLADKRAARDRARRDRGRLMTGIRSPLVMLLSVLRRRPGPVPGFGADRP